MLKLIDQALLNQVIEQAKQSSRLRMNYNLHDDLNDKCQRLLNAMEPGTKLVIHHHKVAEAYIIIQGRIEVFTFDDKGNKIESQILDPKEGCYGIQVPPGTWHSLEVLEADTVIFEVKEGPFIPHEDGGVLSLNEGL